ncbi:MAG: tRNA pseudouridine(55) synthase TruB [Xanthomonadales bacterium]|nr:tRNA pseudouridine(55) synthase TruB [Xanthomonadales bacterium]
MIRRHGRGAAVDGLLLLDKPEGPSSNQVLQRVRRLFGAERAGHCGTLDPLASGLLPVCFGLATRVASLVAGGRKRYRALLRLGIETTTDDREGEAVAFGEGAMPSDEALAEALGAFRGRIRQVPPLWSALKRDGEPLYRRARRGEAPVLEPREVEAFALELRSRPAPELVELEVVCGPGFYVRALARDLGRALGCRAHLAALRRLEVGPFTVDAAFAPGAARGDRGGGGAGRPCTRLLLPIAAALPELPRVRAGRAPGGGPAPRPRPRRRAAGIEPGAARARGGRAGRRARPAGGVSRAASASAACWSSPAEGFALSAERGEGLE